MLGRFREDDDQSSGLDYAKLDNEDLMRREETHESVMNYNDYASQPHIQQFHADMDRSESAEDCRKGGEEEEDGEDSHSDDISHGRQDVREAQVLFFEPSDDYPARPRPYTTTWLDVAGWIHMTESKDTAALSKDNQSPRPSPASSTRSQRARLRRQDILSCSRSCRRSHGSDGPLVLHNTKRSIKTVLELSVSG